MEKSLKIVLVRDVDGKTFWDAFDDAISPRIKAPTSIDESALSTFRSIFQGRVLKKGTFIFLTWLEPSKMLVSLNLYIQHPCYRHSTWMFVHLEQFFIFLFPPPPPPHPLPHLCTLFTWFYCFLKHNMNKN